MTDLFTGNNVDDAGAGDTSASGCKKSPHDVQEAFLLNCK